MCDKKSDSKLKLGSSIFSPTSSFSAFGTPHRLNQQPLKPNFENLFEYQLKQSSNNNNNQEEHRKLESVSPNTATSIRIKKNHKNSTTTAIIRSPSTAQQLTATTATTTTTTTSTTTNNSSNNSDYLMLTPGTLMGAGSSSSYLISPLSGKQLPSPIILQGKHNGGLLISSNSKESKSLLTPSSSTIVKNLINSPGIFSSISAGDFALSPSAFGGGQINQQQLQAHVSGLVKKIEEENVINAEKEGIVKPPTPKLKLPDFSVVKMKKKKNEKKGKNLLTKRKTNRIKRKKRKDEQPTHPPPLVNLPSSSLTLSSSSNIINNNNKREWKLIYKEKGIHLNSTLLTKTRCEQPINYVKDTMYSSLKYEIKHNLTGLQCSNEAFLLGRIIVVDSATGKQVSKNNKSVLKGVVECALTKPTASRTSPNALQGTMKVQFTDVSYHHKKGDFRWEVHYFRPSNLSKPVLIFRSAPFKVFARKPSQKKKRSRTKANLNSQNSSSKRRKLGKNNFDDFVTRLEDLVKCFKKLKNDEERIAMKLVTDKLRIQRQLFQ